MPVATAGPRLGRVLAAAVRMRAEFGAVLLVLLCLAVAGVAITLHNRAGVAYAARAKAAAELATDAERSAELLERRLLRYEALHSLAGVVSAARVPLRNDGGGATALRELKANLDLDRSEVAYVTGMDATGLVRWSTEPLVNGTVDLSREEHVRAIISGGVREAVGAARVGRVVTTYAFRIAKGVFDANDKLIGIVSLSLDPHQLARLILPSSSVPGRFGALLRGDGLVLGTSDPSIALRIPPELLTEALHGGTAAARIGVAGGHYRVAVHRADRFGLVALVGRDEASIDAEAAEAVSRFDTYALGIGGIALIAGVLVMVALVAYGRAEGERRIRLATEAGMARVRQVTDNLQDVVILWEEDGPGVRRFSFVSPSAETMLGVPAAMLIQDPALFRYHPDEVPVIRKRMALLRSGTKVENVETRILRPDGGTVWVETSSENIQPDPAAGAVHPSARSYITCMHDITARKASEAALGEATRRIESLADNSPGVLYEMELEEIPGGELRALVYYISHGLVELTGYPLDMLKRVGAFPRITEAGAFEVRQAAFRHCLAEGNGVCEYAFVTPEGRRTHVRDKFSLVRRTEKGGLIVGYITDMSEEEALRRQLNEAAKLSFLGEMASGIAHELHQPLTAIALQSDALALMVPEDSPVHGLVAQHTSKITALCDRAASVIRRVRAFSRRNTDVAAPFDPVLAIDDGIGILDPRLHAAEVVVKRQFPADAVRVMGHEGPFSQVVMNLIANAIDAYELAAPPPAAPWTIHVTVALQAGQVLVSVADAAGGIPGDVLPRIFEPFFTTKPVGRGTGLGLSISRRIVMDMGGTIVAAQDGDGSRFVITLPAAPMVAEVAALDRALK